MDENLPEKPLLLKLLSITYILNVFDAIVTYYFVTTNRAVELNPFMKFLLDANPTYFIAFKVIIVAFAVYLLYRLSKANMKLAFIAAVVTTVVYSILFSYQVLFITLFLSGRI